MSSDKNVVNQAQFDAESNEQSATNTDNSKSDNSLDDRVMETQIESNDGDIHESEVNQQSDDEESKDHEQDSRSSNEEDDDAPEEVDFKSSKKTARQLLEQQMNVLNRLKRQTQEKRKANQDRNIAQKRMTADTRCESNDSESESDKEEKIAQEFVKHTSTKDLRIILNDDDQVDKNYAKLIKKYQATNNRVISFRERTIQNNSNIKRINSQQFKLTMHKRKMK